MNCTECRDNLVACIEGLLGDEESLQCQAHRETCEACRAEHTAIVHLQQQLVARGQAAADVSIVEPVMRQIRTVREKPERSSIMNIILKHRWGLGLGATAGAVAVILTALFNAPKIQAAAVVVMTKGAEAAAKLTSIHLRGQVRTAPAENFGHIDPAMDFVVIELWKQFEPELKWRVEKPGRVAVMDGQSAVHFLKPANWAMKVPQRLSSAFDTQWLHEMADVSGTLNNELTGIKAHGWPVTLTQEQGADGKMKSVITVEAKSGLPDSDYLKNKFFETSDTRRVYVFDTRTDLLESVKIYLHAASGDELIFDLNQIDYNQSLDPGVFHLELPANVSWYQEPQKLTDNEKYAAMTAQQAARALFEACGREDWTEAAKFFPMPIPEVLKQFLGGLQLISLGEPFTSQGNDARFVPYEIRLKSSALTNQFVPDEIRLNNGVVTNNLALKKDARTGRWIFDGGI